MPPLLTFALNAPMALTLWPMVSPVAAARLTLAPDNAPGVVSVPPLVRLRVPADCTVPATDRLPADCTDKASALERWLRRSMVLVELTVMAPQAVILPALWSRPPVPAARVNDPVA